MVIAWQDCTWSSIPCRVADFKIISLIPLAGSFCDCSPLHVPLSEASLWPQKPGLLIQGVGWDTQEIHFHWNSRQQMTKTESVQTSQLSSCPTLELVLWSFAQLLLRTEPQLSKVLYLTKNSHTTFFPSSHSVLCCSSCFLITSKNIYLLLNLYFRFYFQICIGGNSEEFGIETLGKLIAIPKKS